MCVVAIIIAWLLYSMSKRAIPNESHMAKAQIQHANASNKQTVSFVIKESESVALTNMLRRTVTNEESGELFKTTIDELSGQYAIVDSKKQRFF
jgi:hypothetical protein